MLCPESGDQRLCVSVRGNMSSRLTTQRRRRLRRIPLPVSRGTSGRIPHTCIHMTGSNSIHGATKSASLLFRFPVLRESIESKWHERKRGRDRIWGRTWDAGGSEEGLMLEPKKKKKKLYECVKQSG